MMPGRQQSCGCVGRGATSLRVGDVVPDFTANSTMGKLNCHEWIQSKWTVFFSHPLAFTPVCTTELAMLASVHPTLRKLGFRVIGMSCDSVEDLMEWQKDISAQTDHKKPIDYPIIGDSSKNVAVTLGMLDKELMRKDVQPLTSRTVFIIDPDRRLRLIMGYPDFVGRSGDELVRVCQSLVLCSQLGVATPASWPDNHGSVVVAGKSLAGSVCVPPGLSEQEVQDLFPQSVCLDLPSGLRYMRLTLLPEVRRRQGSCWAGLLRYLPCCSSALPTVTAQGIAMSAFEKWAEAVRSMPRYSTPSMVKLVPVAQEAKASLQKRAQGMEAFDSLYVPSTDGHLRHGDIVPDFSADSTKGRFNFHRHIDGYWSLLYVAPKAFCPVATTELGTLGLLYGSFASKRIRVVAISAESAGDLAKWEKDIQAHFELKSRLQFPLVSDSLQDIAARFDVEVDEPSVSPRDAAQFLPRSIFLAAPDMRLKLLMTYPAEVGFDIHEILRVCDALQLTRREGVATPASWPNNHADVYDEAGNSMQGSVFPLDTIAKEEIPSLFPTRVDVRLPSKRNYMTLAKIDEAGRMPVCAGCVAFGSA
mmetsp:Transcript_114041/g.329427  ORF Transcript_114041/g.329427 Transcript_114041/m.329427 type:complete len:587 (-) Transcript_114041:94-1854(-)